MSKICFVSYEIHPVTRGGCGVLLYNSTHLLLQQGHQVIFLFDMAAEDFEQFDPGIYPNAHNCKAYRIENLCLDIPLEPKDFPSLYTWRAYRFHWAAKKIVDLEQPDLIEFFDYNGPAHYALAAKLTQSHYQDTHLAIRLHNSDQLMDLHQPTRPLTRDTYFLYALEHSALRLAETILYPSQTYLDDAYRAQYEPWLGQVVHSKPALSDHPRLHDTQQKKHRILFYGRLYGFKGVDIFIDAAVIMLSQADYNDLCFTLVGFDSKAAPDGSKTYQDYLMKKIPNKYKSQFEFTGQISWPELEALLPEVWCAVFPGYFESFCYAAHELYAAGIPVLLNDIPAFRGYFKDRENALLFDGTTMDLAKQMKILWEDKALRETIKRPYSLTENPLGNFYRGPFLQTWMRTGHNSNDSPSLLICVLDDNHQNVIETLSPLDIEDNSRVQILLFSAWSDQAETGATPLWFLGKLYRVTNPAGKPVDMATLYTKETLLILRAGDVVKKEYISTCLDVLARQPELSFVGCWKEIQRNGQLYLDTFPIDAALELVPFGNLPLLNRMVMRTEPGRLLVDLFEPRLMQMGEISYLWHLESRQGPGLIIPEPLLRLNEEQAATKNSKLLSYLIANDPARYRKARLTNYLMTIWTAQEAEIPAEQARYSEEIVAIVQTFGASKIGRLIGENPVIVKWSKTVLRWFRQNLTRRG